ncbi:MAG: exonuclease domain-containing protein [Flaviflexus sp.]|nr:exonuclease domain-containing protein [Flaviflexus sp.]
MVQRLNDIDILGFDTETTGVSPHHSRLVTAAIVESGPEEVSATWLANPGVDIPSAAREVHGISTEHAREHGRPADEVLLEVRDYLLRGLREGKAILAFNASFDLTLLESELTRHGLATMTELLGTEPAPIIDPLVLDRMLAPRRRGPRRLENLCQVYGVTASGFHDARADVVASLRLFEAMKTQHAILAPLTVDKAHELQRASHRDWARSFNRWLASKGRTPDVAEAWPLLPPRGEGA